MVSSASKYRNGSAPAYHDGADGLAHLDYVIKKAKDEGIRLVFPLVNNWSTFGGMDQYVAWAGGQFHDDFYTNPTIKGWYKAWISHLLNRVNPLTGIGDKNDPTIMMWELANEPQSLNVGERTILERDYCVRPLPCPLSRNPQPPVSIDKAHDGWSVLASGPCDILPLR